MTDTATHAMPFDHWMHTIRQRTEDSLLRLLPPQGIIPNELHNAMHYAVLSGGKRVRALLAHAAGEITQAPAHALDLAASSVECIHAYSLVHDDLPCMDDDVLRRGKPTVHVQFGEPVALLAGDALQTLAFEILSEHNLCHDPQTQLDLIALLASAAGSRGMAGGQAIDLAATGQRLSLEALEMMHIHKTGALIRSSILLGARCGENVDATQLKILDRYGKLAGLLFQVVDDILDACADTNTLGKTAGKDAAADKATYVSLLGLEDARRMAARLLDEACQSIAPLADKGQRLQQLVHYIAQRSC